jgi:hypothetical protein
MTVTDNYDIYYSTRSLLFKLNGLDTTSGLTFQYLGDQGFGLAPLHRITTRGPLQNGDSDLDFRLDPRVMQIPLVVKNDSATPKYHHYEIREKLLDIFRPLNASQVWVERFNGTTYKNRRIDVKVLGGLSFDVDPDNYHVRTVVQLRADDPTWYTEGSVSNVVEFNQSQFGTTRSGTNIGNWISFPTILVTGPVTNFRITRTSGSSQFIQYNGTIPSGTVVRFDLRYGLKTVTNNATGANLIANVSADSNLATFSLVPGVNQFTATGTGLSAATAVQVTWLDRFTGI